MVPPLQKRKAEVSALQDSELAFQLPECRLLRTHCEGTGLLLPPDKGVATFHECFSEDALPSGTQPSSIFVAEIAQIARSL